jgi:hypothetical protein
MVPFLVKQADGNGPGAYMQLRYAGRSPCRCFAPVLDSLSRRITPREIDEHLPQAHLLVSSPTGPRVASFPSFLQPLSESLRAPHTQTKYPRH